MAELLGQYASFQSLGSPSRLRFFALLLIVLFFVVVFCLLFVPWQQTVTGVGKVTVFDPVNRPQSIEAQLSGRIKKWYVKEGQSVEAGELLAELDDIDPKYLSPLQVPQLEAQKQALAQRQKATQMRIVALNRQLASLSVSQQASLPAAGVRVQQNRVRVFAAQQSVIAAEQAEKTAKYNFDRLQSLFDKGLRSRRDYELAELDYRRAQTELERARAQFGVSQQDVSVSSLDQSKVLGDTSAALANVSSALASAQESLASTQAEISKLDVEVEGLRRRVSLREIRSPRAGTVVRIMRLGEGETVSEGMVIATVVPFSTDQAVELYVSDWDAVLLKQNDPVRLQFSGWPAIQFSGWPSIATGTFGGRVAVIDAVDDGTSRYRVLVRPDMAKVEEGRDQPWPSQTHLRPGTTASGWILLRRVPLGYELWRQFNGFPPTVDMTEKDADAGDVKDKKGPIKRKVKS
jgi:membrane fusion protein, adhesin transport system